MDGGKRGQVVKVCADIPLAAPTTPTRLLRSRSSGERAEERKRIEKEKLGDYDSPSYPWPGFSNGARSIKEGRNLLGRSPTYLIGHLSYSQVPTSGEAAQGRGEEGLCVPHRSSGQASRKFDDVELCKLFWKSASGFGRISDPPQGSRRRSHGRRQSATA